MKGDNNMKTLVITANLENEINNLETEFKEAMELLKHDSNKTALRELRARIKNNDFKN